MNSLVCRNAVPVGARYLRGRLIPFCALERRRAFARMPDQSYGFTRARMHRRLKGAGPVNCLGIGIGPSICRPVMARSEWMAVLRHAPSGATFHVVAWGSQEVVS